MCSHAPGTGGAIVAYDVSGHELGQARKTSGQGSLLYTIPGSVWPPGSLFNKFRRLYHRNKARSSSSRYLSKPKSLASEITP